MTYMEPAEQYRSLTEHRSQPDGTENEVIEKDASIHVTVPHDKTVECGVAYAYAWKRVES